MAPSVGLFASSHDIAGSVPAHLGPSTSSLNKITGTTHARLGSKLFHGIAPHPPRGRRYFENPIKLDVGNIPASSMKVQADFLTADIKLTADGRMIILEFNGLNSGLSGYKRLYPHVGPEDRNLRTIFFEILSNTGHPLIWLEPSRTEFERDHYTTYWSKSAKLIGKVQCLEAGAESMSITDFTRQFTPKDYLLAYGMYMLEELYERPLDKVKFSNHFERFISEGLISADDVEALFQKQVESGDLLMPEWLCDDLAEFAQKIPSPYDKDSPKDNNIIPFVLATSIIHAWTAYSIAFISIIGETISSSKVSIASLFTGPAAIYHPKTIQFKRSEYEELDIETILAQLQSPLITLKAPNLWQGKGIAHLRREELASSLAYLFRDAANIERETKARIEERHRNKNSANSSEQKRVLRYSRGDMQTRLSLGINLPEVHNFRSGAYGNDFLLQEYVPSRGVHSPLTGLSYDGTMRLVFGLVREESTVHFYPLDAYWKLPQRALGADGRGHENSDVKRGGSLAVSEGDYQLVIRQMTEALQIIYPGMLRMDQ